MITKASFFDTERGKAALAASRRKAAALSAAMANVPLDTESLTYIAPPLIQHPWHRDVPSESEES